MAVCRRCRGNLPSLWGQITLLDTYSIEDVTKQPQKFSITLLYWELNRMENANSDAADVASPPPFIAVSVCPSARPSVSATQDDVSSAREIRIILRRRRRHPSKTNNKFASRRRRRRFSVFLSLGPGVRTELGLCFNAIFRQKVRAC